MSRSFVRKAKWHLTGLSVLTARAYPLVTVDFRTHDCHPCPVRDLCTQKNTGARRLKLHPKDQHCAGIGGTFSQAIHALDLRSARYRAAWPSKSHHPYLPFCGSQTCVMLSPTVLTSFHSPRRDGKLFPREYRSVFETPRHFPENSPFYHPFLFQNLTHNQSFITCTHLRVLVQLKYL